MTLTAEHIIAALGTEPKATTQNWPLIQNALRENGMSSVQNDIAVAATILIEVGRGFQPIAEKRMVVNESAPPSKQAYQAKIKAYQDKYWSSGYYGRGFIQHTRDRNYRWLQDKLGLPLLAKPEMLMDPVVSAKALAAWWKENRCHIAAYNKDWAGVRRIVNGAHMLHLSEFLAAVSKLESALDSPQS